MSETNLVKNEVVGSWRLEKELGAGGQGTVWRVRYIKDKHSAPGALKICTSTSEKARRRFQQEIELLRAQSHPNIVRVRDSGEHGQLPYFVMELATTTLGHVTTADTAGTRLILESREVAFRIIRQACAAIAHMHSSNILHRDIKPSNILLMLDPPEPMRAVVADLGIATNEIDQGKLTATHEMIGTPAFRAPESLTGKHTTRSDVYSLGKTIEALLNRATPTQLGPCSCLRDQQLTDDLWDVLDGVLARATAFDPGARFEDAGALLEALPTVVLGLNNRDAPQFPAQRRTTISLTVAERATLWDFISECPATDSRINLAYVQRRCRVKDYHFSLSVRRLEDIGFLQTFTEYDSDGDKYTLVSPSQAAITWAHEHSDEMTSAIAEITPKATSDGDIPF